VRERGQQHTGPAGLLPNPAWPRGGAHAERCEPRLVAFVLVPRFTGRTRSKRVVSSDKEEEDNTTSSTGLIQEYMAWNALCWNGLTSACMQSLGLARVIVSRVLIAGEAGERGSSNHL
jgi:hypothetical protein